MTRGKASLRAVRAPGNGEVSCKLSGERPHGVELEEIDQVNLTIKLALQLDLDFGHHERRCPQIEKILIESRPARLPARPPTPS